MLSTTSRPADRRFVLIVMDGAADRVRIDGRSPLAAAQTPALDRIAQLGVSGLMTTLYEELPKESLVAHLGMLGWEPHVYYPGGRGSSELEVVPGVRLKPGDVVFRANLARVVDAVLRSFSAHSIDTAKAAQLARKVDTELRPEFAEFELYHVGEYRTLLLVRDANVAHRTVSSVVPHENEGLPIALDRLVTTSHQSSEPFVSRVNAYLSRAAELLSRDQANCLLPWGLSTALRLPPFAASTGFDGKSAIVGAMAFLAGIAAAGGLEFYSVGNGRPDTDYAAKGRAVLELLRGGYGFVCCHVNAADEASHLHDPRLKIGCIEHIDSLIVRPIFDWMRHYDGGSTGLLVMSDHYANSGPEGDGRPRSECHSIDPVPFSLWNGRDRDGVVAYGEDAARLGRYGSVPINHLRLLELIGVTSSGLQPGAPGGQLASVRHGTV
jgi:2,3-bisphosphoglycerate-independent phosphoglycerate mutase